MGRLDGTRSREGDCRRKLITDKALSCSSLLLYQRFTDGEENE